MGNSWLLILLRELMNTFPVTLIILAMLLSGCQKDTGYADLSSALESSENRQSLLLWVEAEVVNRSSDLVGHLTPHKLRQPGDFIINLDFDWTILGLHDSGSNRIKLFGSPEYPKAVGFYFGSRDYMVVTVVEQDVFVTDYPYLLGDSTWIENRICLIRRSKGF